MARLKKAVKYSSNPEDRVKNKDGTIKRFPNERFVGDIVVNRYYSWNNRWTGERRVLSLLGPNRVILEGFNSPVYTTYTKVIRKAQ